MEVLIVAPRNPIFLDALGELDEAVSVTAVGWESGRATEGVRFIDVPPQSGFTARVRAAILPIARKNTIVRSLLRLSGFDEGVWFFKAVSRIPEASAAAHTAHVIIASERDAIYTVWQWGRERGRSGAPAVAVHGYPAGRAAIAQSLGR